MSGVTEGCVGIDEFTHTLMVVLKFTILQTKAAATMHTHAFPPRQNSDDQLVVGVWNGHCAAEAALNMASDLGQ